MGNVVPQLSGTEVIALLGLIVGTAVQLIALIVAVSKLLTAATASEVRSTERFVRLETKTERVEKDVQDLFRMANRRSTDT